MATTRLELTRREILAFRRKVGALEERLAWGARSLRRAAWAGLQDSVPRAAQLSIAARLAGSRPDAWEHPSLVQVWGPRFSAYIVAKQDLPVFTVGRMSDNPRTREIGEDLARRLADLLGDGAMPYGEAGRALGEPPNRLRYAAPTGTILIRWDGARQPTIRRAPQPEMDPVDARLELARRFLHVFGPADAEGFRRWAGIGRREAIAAFERLDGSLTPVQTPLGEARILGRDEAAFRLTQERTTVVRLLPSGDAYYLLHGDGRRLLIRDAARRDELWTSRVWPGALLVGGEIVGTWRRTTNTVTVRPWKRLTRREREAIESEAVSMPLPGVEAPIVVDWGGA